MTRKLVRSRKRERYDSEDKPVGGGKRDTAHASEVKADAPSKTHPLIRWGANPNDCRRKFRIVGDVPPTGSMPAVAIPTLSLFLEVES